MTTTEIANRLVELCRQGDWNTCYKELFDDSIKSVEADGKVSNGFAEIAQKGEEWNASIEEFHGSTVSDPIVAGNHFSLVMTMDLKYKGAPQATTFEELCVYKVKDGKVVQEQFFYDAP